MCRASCALISTLQLTTKENTMERRQRLSRLQPAPPHLLHQVDLPAVQISSLVSGHDWYVSPPRTSQDVPSSPGRHDRPAAGSCFISLWSFTLPRSGGWLTGIYADRKGPIGRRCWPRCLLMCFGSLVSNWLSYGEISRLRADPAGGPHILSKQTCRPAAGLHHLPGQDGRQREQRRFYPASGT